MNPIILLSALLLAVASVPSSAQQAPSPMVNSPLISKNNIVNSLLARISDRPECVQFQDRLRDVAKTADRGDNARFTNDIRQILHDVKASDCVFQPDSVAGN